MGVGGAGALTLALAPQLSSDYSASHGRVEWSGVEWSGAPDALDQGQQWQQWQYRTD